MASDVATPSPERQTTTKLTESLAAPLIAHTRKHYEQELARKEIEVASREAVIHALTLKVQDKEEQIASMRRQIEELGHKARQGSTQIYLPSKGPDSWRAFLAQPDQHWRTGFSAKTLAYCWESASARGSLPPEIAGMFAAHSPNPELMLALPEHKVPLPGSSRGDSQSDLFVIIRTGDTTFAATIEGKVDEPFDKPLAEWMRDASPGKQQRLAFICELLGLTQPVPGDIYYQLLHRTAAAIIEARRFKTDAACMIVHSFSRSGKWYSAFDRFASLFRVPTARGSLLPIRPSSFPPLYIGWAVGDPQFLLV